MSSSVSISIATNSAIAGAKGFGWLVTGSPTLFAEMVHSFADVGNQILLKVGEVRGRGAPDSVHPFGRGQEKFFWALVSAVSVFFIGCGINLYHGVHALMQRQPVEPFTPLIIALLIFALLLELWTFNIALKEIGGWAGLRGNRTNTTVLAVLLEDAVALLGILLTLLVAGTSWVWGPHPEFDAAVAIFVGLLLGAMALFLATLNRRLLIDVADPEVDQAAQRWLATRDIQSVVKSLVLDDNRAIVFVRVQHEVRDSFAVGEALKAELAKAGKTIDEVYWKAVSTA
ncbi:MAG: cation diffusion facilitator family transporter [Betaproteobacteria bacterium]